jgi:hypothetical protein
LLFDPSGWYKLVTSGAAKKSFPEITIFKSVTLGTRVCCAVLKAYAKAYLQENPQGQASVSSFTSRPPFTYRPSKTVRQISLTFCKTVLSDELPEPASEDLEQAYRIAGTRQFKGQLCNTFMILNDDHVIKLAKSNPKSSKPAKPSQNAAEPMEDVSGQGPSGSQPSQVRTPANTKAIKRKGCQGPTLIEGVHKLSRM